MDFSLKWAPFSRVSQSPPSWWKTSGKVLVRDTIASSWTNFPLIRWLLICWISHQSGICISYFYMSSTVHNLSLCDCWFLKENQVCKGPGGRGNSEKNDTPQFFTYLWTWSSAFQLLNDDHSDGCATSDSGKVLSIFSS